MEVYRIHISSWTASFRYPNLISGFQPTLMAPPLSTVLGLINAAAGNYLNYQGTEIGYYFKYETKAADLETIYQYSSSKGKPNLNTTSNVLQREFLFNNDLYIYLKDRSLAALFRSPYYPLLLGRSNDLASIMSIDEVELVQDSHSAKLGGQVIPLDAVMLPGTIQALPTYFTNDIPRNNLGTRPFTVIDWQKSVNAVGLPTYRDPDLQGKAVDIYVHQVKY